MVSKTTLLLLTERFFAVAVPWVAVTPSSLRSNVLSEAVSLSTAPPISLPAVSCLLTAMSVWYSSSIRMTGWDSFTAPFSIVIV